MSQPVKRFTSAKPKGGDPIVFELEFTRYTYEDQSVEGSDGGTTRVRVAKDEVETFLAHPDVSGGVTLQMDLMSGLRFGQGTNARGADAVVDFFEGALLPEDYTRFKALIDDKDVHIDAKTISAIAVWLYERYSSSDPQGERPTGPSGS